MKKRYFIVMVIVVAALVGSVQLMDIFDSEKPVSVVRNSKQLSSKAKNRFVVAKKKYLKAMTTGLYSQNRIQDLKASKDELLKIRKWRKK